MIFKDFQSHSKLKFIVPLTYLLSWLSMILGPVYFPFLYNEYCMLMILYLAVRSVVLCGLNVKLVMNYHNLMKNASKDEEKRMLMQQRLHMEVYHAFVIPSYNQDAELLAETLFMLSQHEKASQSYLIFLAMEKHQLDSDKKALKLIDQFKGKFLNITYTLHLVKPTEHKGKASNVSFCAQNMHTTFDRLMIDEQSVFLTIVDADSWAPQVYIDEVEKHIFQHFESRHQFIYQPPQIYTRNSLEVCALIRTYDDMYSSMHASSLVSVSGISFSLSNYTLSYSLVKRVGFWDTVEEAIGEDMHMCLKAMFKTDGEVKTVPVYTPFNQLNIQTGNGTVNDVKAKFWQIQRHARGVADVSYCIHMLMTSKFTLKTFWTTISLIEAFFLPIVTPWVIISIFCQQILSLAHLFSYQEKLRFSQEDFFFVITIANVGTFVANLIYQVFKRRSTKQIYALQNASIFRVFEGSILYTINLIFVTVPAFVIGAFGNLKMNRQYIVTEKNSVRLLKGQVNKGQVNKGQVNVKK